MKTKMLKIGLLLAATFTLAGCGSMMQQNRSVHCAGSLYPYLNTNVETQAGSPQISPTAGPLKVGVAFVPGFYSSEGLGRSSLPGEQLSADDKLALLERVSRLLKQYSFVKSVETVPSTYLGTNGGFEILDNLRSTLGVDTMLLLAYDQSQFSDEGALAMSYWTIVGAYFVRGERNETKTVLEAAFYDIGSHRLLFRATGTSIVKASATPVNLSEQLRRDNQQGFNEAMIDLVPRLQMQLDQLDRSVGK
jgi:rhombotail lipoprotein